LGAILLLAAILRFWALPGRGTWDADQGHDMLVLLGLVRDGTVPLLGPPTSIGAFHHGALYYYLLSPAAFLTGADPTAVVAEIALFGVAAVAVTWFLARSIAGPVAGFAAALIMAVSASAIDESTFIWNPNLIALSSSVALAAAWRARTTGQPRWWLLAAFGVLVTMQCHVLGIALLPPVLYLWAVTRRTTAVGPDRRRFDRYALGGLAIIVLGYLPLLAYELGHDFAETRAALAFIASGGTGVSVSLPVRLVFVGLRILAWPLTGLLVDGLVIGVVASLTVASGLVWRTRASDPDERAAARWLALTVLFGWVVLTLGASGLSSVTPLPVDHYHAFLDPVVFVALGLGSAAVWRGGRAPRERTCLRVALAVALGVLIAWNVSIWPPLTAVDGGWPAALETGTRIAAITGQRPIQLLGLPDFKSTEAIGFPLDRRGLTVAEDIPPTTTGGRPPTPPDPRAAVVIVCDSLFVTDCGGPAEDGALATPGAWPVRLVLADRWLAAPGRTVSVYLPGT
jgi:Dolichyl-phosphate-mannose-protein mannosyltransferase